MQTLPFWLLQPMTLFSALEVLRTPLAELVVQHFFSILQNLSE